MQKTDKDWKSQLSDEQYRVLRQSGTERAFTGKFYYHEEKGTYVCAACQNELFADNAKFDSGCGWPSFYEPVSKDSIRLLPDNTHGMERTEVQCGVCHSHLGHVFADAPNTPTGLRYCINSVALGFEDEQGNYEEDNK